MGLVSAAALTLTLVVVLFAIATLVESRGTTFARRPRLRHAFYTLALGVYCTSWTFYGAVGSAVRDGWNYLPIYVAPMALLLLAPGLLRRLARAVAEERATSVSDFIAARFGHDVSLARLVTVTALAGTIPYLALQLRSIGSVLAIVSGRPVEAPAMTVAALLLAVFAMLFGARRFELAGRSEGLLFAIGLDSLFKLFALAVVAAFAATILWAAAPADLARAGAKLAAGFAPARFSLEVAMIALLSLAAIIGLPRQFYMGLVEAQEPDDLPRARLGFAAYLAAMALLVVPIALAGIITFGSAMPPDLYVVEVPAVLGTPWVTGLALLGGVGAAASMAIVEATALSTMVSNDIVFPSLIRTGAPPQPGVLGNRMLLVRRGSILVIMALALVWALLVSPKQPLASIGLIAFAAMAQFAPHLLLAARAGDRDPRAARASIAVGLALWLYTLALPPVLPAGWLALLKHTPLDPENLFGLGGATPLIHGVVWSLGANQIVFWTIAAMRFSGPALPRLLGIGRHVTDLEGLFELTVSFVGQEQADAAFPARRRGVPVNRTSARRAQELIGRVVGTSSAHALVTSALSGGPLSLPDVRTLLDAGGQSLRFSRRLLAATFENLDAGISVVDAELKLVAWNSRYAELFDYPPGLLQVGVPVEELIRYNVARGDFGKTGIEENVRKRLDHLRRGEPYEFERRRHDGRVIKSVGGPMPDSGYVTSFTDITEEARTRDELQRTLAGLEQRVAERTSELSAANARLARATRDKTRFLAAASHDLLQPLHAARLFSAALERDVDERALPLVRRVESSIVAAEDLLRALLDISRLDAGGIEPDAAPVDLAPFLADLADSFRPQAAVKGLRLRTGPLAGVVETDAGLLRSLLQNFVANAVRYTEHGGVLIGVRRRGERLRIDVVDTGVGIEPAQIDAIFGEFTRLGTVEAEGLGLGLALAERIANLLGAKIEVASEPGRGSRFSLLLPAHAAAVAPVPAAPPPPAPPAATGRKLAVLVVDNDARIVEASLSLLERMGHHPLGATSLRSALPHARKVDAVLADYQLDDGEDGLALIAALRAEAPGLPAALITAQGDAALAARAWAMGVPVIAKPADPAAIAAFLAWVSVL